MRFGLSIEQVHHVVEEGMGIPSGGYEVGPFGDGKFSSTFLVETPTGEQRVLRIAPPDGLRLLFYERRMMRQEPGLHRLIRRQANLPVPPILQYDFTRRLVDRDWLVMARLPGESLVRMGSRLSAARREAVMETLGRHVRDLHTIRAKRYGYLGRHRPMAPQRTWPEAFTLMFERLIADVRDTGVIDSSAARMANDALRDHLDVFPADPGAALCHMDLWGANLLVDESGRLTGLLDFDRACWGHVENEFAVAEYCGLATPGFWRGYGFDPARDDAWAVRRFFYLIYEHAKYIVIRTSERHRNDRSAAVRYAGDCFTALCNFGRTGQPVF